MTEKRNTTWENLHQTALKAPQSSGVYLWHNEQDVVIYVGKAKNLKNRLSSYFSGKRTLKTKLLVAHAKWIEYITTNNEYEALILENNLIKKYSPRYNINLKDGKSYPVLRITNEDFPKVFRTRRILQDGSTYFGPFPDVNALDFFLESIYKLYPIRHCRLLRNRDTPCLYYHMNQCKGPCCKKISKDEYNSYIEEIKHLLQGNSAEAVQKMTDEMKDAAKKLNFEKAARLRDGIKALQVLQNQNIVETFDSEDRDYIAYASEGELVSFTVLKFRNGKLLGRENFRAESLNDDEDLIGEFMTCYYEEKNAIPPTIFIPQTSEYEHIAKWLKEAMNCESQLIQVSTTDSIARDVAAIQMAKHNAKEDIIRRLRDRGDIPAMQELKEKLNLDVLPVRIEGFDIAHIGGKWPVASLISFYNGNPDKKNYRYFRLKTTDGLIDDFASMKEAVSRRYSRLLNEQSDLPDLILIDGGIGQVNAVEEILNSLGLDIPVAGLAKRDEEIYLPGNSTPICLPKRSDALRLLQRVRDETHRFATSRNQALRTKENVKSVFLKIDGVGEKRAVILQKEFTTLENLAQSSAEKISEVLKIKISEAQIVLGQAIELNKIRNQKKDVQRLSLGAAGTTKEKAAEATYINNLADLALQAAENEMDYGD